MQPVVSQLQSVNEEKEINSFINKQLAELEKTLKTYIESVKSHILTSIQVIIDSNRDTILLFGRNTVNVTAQKEFIPHNKQSKLVSREPDTEC